jgi:hypothetical protein
MNWTYEKERVYSTNEEGKIMAEALLKEKGKEVEIQRVYVDDSLRGQGVAGKIMEVVMAYLRENNKKVIPVCSYAQGWLEKNREEYQDVLK